MSLFSNPKGKPVSENYTPKPMEAACQTARLRATWDIESADYVYELQVYHHRLGISRVQDGATHSWGVLASGDLDWAQRTAKHYDLKIEKEQCEANS